MPWIQPDLEPTLYQQQQVHMLHEVQMTAAQCELELITNQVTRSQGSDMAAALDVILVNKPSIVHEVSYVPSQSDHMLVNCSLNFKMSKKNQVTRYGRTYNKYDKKSCMIF